MLKANELFVRKSKLISESSRKKIEIHDFIVEIEDEVNLKNGIRSPKFKIAGIEFSIDVYPENSPDDASGFIGVYLDNHGNEDQTTSITVKEASGVKNSWKMDTVSAGSGWGFPKFISHEKYREWAKVQDDVLSLEVVVTLHKKAEGDGWTYHASHAFSKIS